MVGHDEGRRQPNGSRISSIAALNHARAAMRRAISSQRHAGRAQILFWGAASMSLAADGPCAPTQLKGVVPPSGAHAPGSHSCGTSALHPDPAARTWRSACRVAAAGECQGKAASAGSLGACPCVTRSTRAAMRRLGQPLAQSSAGSAPPWAGSHIWTWRPRGPPGKRSARATADRGVRG